MTPIQFSSIPLFAELSPSESATIAQLLQPRTLAPGEVLFWIGETGDAFYVIQKGQISISFPDHSGREMFLAKLSAGNFLGEISLLDGGPRSATARAVEETLVLGLPRLDFLTFVMEHPAVAVRLMRVLGARQRETVERLRGIRNANEVALDHATVWHRVAASIAAVAASHWFILMHAVGLMGWISLNLLLGEAAPDPFPFLFLGFWASTEAIFLSLFILVSQNVQTRKDRVRTEIEYQVALKMQLEIMQLHQKMDSLRDDRRKPEGNHPVVLESASSI
jgi:uncharacterized membrane protein